MNKTDFVLKYIMNNIKNETYETGKKIPGEIELKNTLNVSRYTVRCAINRLCKENILETRQGSGSFVKNISKKHILIIIHSGCIIGNTRSTSNYIKNRLKEVLTEKNYIPFIYIDESNKNINRYIEEIKENIAGIISIRARENTLKYLEKYKIPIVSILCSTATDYPSVLVDYPSFFREIINIIHKYKLKNLLVFSINYSINKKEKDNFYLYAIMQYLKKYNLKLISMSENIPAALSVFRNTLKNMKKTPDGIIFLDDTIFNTCYKIFPEFEETLKHINIITESSGYIDYGNDYNICQIQFNLDNIVDKSIAFLSEKINNSKLIQSNIYIKPVVINENIFTKPIAEGEENLK